MSDKVSESDVQLEVNSLESPIPLDIAARAKMEAEICKKLDMRIMPVLTLIFLFAYIDRFVCTIFHSERDGEGITEKYRLIMAFS